MRRVRATAASILAGALAMGGLAAVSAIYPAASQAAPASSARPTPVAGAASSCQLGHGVKHVVNIIFDNVHFNRDNPDVPSDLEMIPNLENFIENNGALLSNNHTPLIAHTADDSLTTYTGLYGDRAGMPISNDYEVYNTDGPNNTYGTTDNAGSFAYWTDPVYYADGTPSAGDTNPSMVYSSVPPATSVSPITPTNETPAPWVPFTRAGCNVGDVSTANMVLENTSEDIPKVFGANSPEAQQLAADPDFFKDPETADYVGLAVHCTQGAALCADAQAVKYGQTTASSTAVADQLPDEPGGYSGYEALFGHKYIAPVLGAGNDDVTRHGFQVTNAAGNLVDENGNQLDGAFLTNHPGFPGFSNINASQTLAYTADMLESGVQVTYGYIGDIHGNEFIPALSQPPANGQPAGPCYHAPDALGSGSACYIAQADYYNQAFGTFFQRLASDGITAQNTEFVFSSDEGDHEAGANVGRAVQPTPANCDGVTVVCTYPAGTFGELEGNVTGLLAEETGDTTQFGMEFDTAPEFYVNGQPGPDTSGVRQFEHDLASLTAFNPYAGSTQQIANYMADPAEEAILHMVNADPARTPTVSVFARPDYYLEQGPATCDDAVTGTTASEYPADCVTVDNGFAWDHGDYAAEIDNNWVGFVGPGVQHLGLDGSTPENGPNSAGPNSGQVTSVQINNPGTWVDETDIQPTMLYLAGLHDDYTPDGRVISQIVAPNPALDQTAAVHLATCYKQLNSSVGEFGAGTLIADTNAVKSTSSGDTTYRLVDAAIRGLEIPRDYLADVIKTQLGAAAFSGVPIPTGLATAETVACQLLINAASQLGASTSAATARGVTAGALHAFAQVPQVQTQLGQLARVSGLAR